MTQLTQNQIKEQVQLNINKIEAMLRAPYYNVNELLKLRNMTKILQKQLL